MKAIVLLSGGLDSATAAAIAHIEGYELIGLSFDYGQRHDKELHVARLLAEKYCKQHFVLNVPLWAWGASALTDKSIDVPQDGPTHQIPVTYVPGRNTVFLALALSLAEAKGAEAIYLGINAVDYSGYPDCRPEYLEVFQSLAALSSKAGIEGNAPRLVAPLVTMSKVDIVREALRLKVPIEDTWSCYLGGETPCGLCDSCRIRDAAIAEVSIETRLSLSENEVPICRID